MQLLGGASFEPHQANPVFGFRGASRNERSAGGFALECGSLRRASSLPHTIATVRAAEAKTASRAHPRQEFQLPAHLLDGEREAAAGAGAQHGIGCQPCQ